MPIVDLVNQTTLRRSARVLQLEGLFDVPPSERSEVTIHASLPIEERDWNIGLICGASGCGKSTLARHLWPDQVQRTPTWSPDRAVVDDFPAHLSVKTVVQYLSGVGFSSPPAWLRPFRHLSTGEQFRVEVARRLADAENDDSIVVVDEFSSVVDRQVAKVASHTIAKAIRQRARRFVAVSCHLDIIDWLQPDWVYRPDLQRFEWRELQRRPSLDLTLWPVGRDAWPLFSPHHYLSRVLSSNATCFVAMHEGEPVAFTSYTPFPHPRVRDIRMGHRLVVLPDYQGIGIGGRLDDWLGHELWLTGYRYHNRVCHPAMIAYYERSPRWRRIAAGFQTRGGDSVSNQGAFALRRHIRRISIRRVGVSYEYVERQEAA